MKQNRRHDLSKTLHVVFSLEGVEIIDSNRSRVIYLSHDQLKSLKKLHKKYYQDLFVKIQEQKNAKEELFRGID